MKKFLSITAVIAIIIVAWSIPHGARGASFEPYPTRMTGTSTWEFTNTCLSTFDGLATSTEHIYMWSARPSQATSTDNFFYYINNTGGVANTGGQGPANFCTNIEFYKNFNNVFVPPFESGDYYWPIWVGPNISNSYPMVRFLGFLHFHYDGINFSTDFGDNFISIVYPNATTTASTTYPVSYNYGISSATPYYDQICFDISNLEDGSGALEYHFCDPDVIYDGNVFRSYVSATSSPGLKFINAYFSNSNDPFTSPSRSTSTKFIVVSSNIVLTIPSVATCNPFSNNIATLFLNINFSVPNCLEALLTPQQSFLEVFGNRFPIGYITDFASIISGVATSSLTVIDAYLPSALGVGSAMHVHLDLAHSLDFILNATSSIFNNSSASSTKTVYEITSFYWNLIVYLGTLFYILGRIFGTHIVGNGFGDHGSLSDNSSSDDSYKLKEKLYQMSKRK